MNLAQSKGEGSEGPAPSGIPFTIGAQSCRYFSNLQTVSNFAGAGSFTIVPLAATGWIRSIELLFTATYTTSGSAAVTGADAPWNLIQSIQLTDAQGKPIVAPISGYNQMLVNKYLPSGTMFHNNRGPYCDPRTSPEFAFSASGTSGTATFRLRIDLEINEDTGYGCIPNMDANASPQLKVMYNQYNHAFTGGTASAATLTMRTTTHYYSPASSAGSVPVLTTPPGAGDYLQTRYETATITAGSEYIYNLQSKGGLLKGSIFVLRNAGVRTALTPGSNFGTILDNQPIDESVPVEEILTDVRRWHGFAGTDATGTGTPYTPLTAGVAPGCDVGVVPLLYFSRGPYNDGWLNTLVGSSLQHKMTSGSGATSLEVITVLTQPSDYAAFHVRS